MIVLLAYLLAIFGAWISIQFFPDQEIWIKIAVGDFVGTFIIFIYSRLLRNSSMYDPYWSVAPMIILLYLVIAFGIEQINIRMVLVSIVVIYWGVRLTLNWLKTWPGLLHEDWRYRKLAQDTGSFYWFVSFMGIHLLPTVFVYLACLPLIPIVSSNEPIIWTDILGFVISIAAIEIERRADLQLRYFKTDKSKDANSVCDLGLWKYSRHPNYFGEISFWAGIFIIAFGQNPEENMLYGIGLICMIILFVFISIPMMEKRQLKKEGYNEYKMRVSMLVPWFPKR